MQGEELDCAGEEHLRSLMPQMMLNTRIAQSLGKEIRRAAAQKMRYRAAMRGRMPLEDVVIELRKLVRLLRKTLVPVQPRSEFARSLGEQLQVRGTELAATRQRRWLWLMAGSLLSLLGVATALLLRRRNGRLQTGKPVGVM